MKFPEFRYHPNPVMTGAIVKTDEECECCEKYRGYRAASAIYSIRDVETICPWCIADGSAAAKFDGEFSDSHPLLEDGVDKGIVKEVCERTPSFISWQQERWLSHCSDACIFLGGAKASDLNALAGEDLNEFLNAEYIIADDWPSILQAYSNGGGVAVYKFQCRGCGTFRYYSDRD